MIVVIVILLFILFLVPRRPTSRHEQNIKKLARQAARYSIAAEQDKSPMIAVLHANYGKGYFDALELIATPTEIKRATGVDIKKFGKDIHRIQDKATIEMIRACPSFGPDPSYLTSIAGEGI